MQFDKTRIAVRERNQLDIFDLSLHILRQYAAPLLATLLLGAAPLAVANHLLIGWMLDLGDRQAFSYWEDAGSIIRFVWAMMALVIIEAPLASVFATAYLGQAVFIDRPPIRRVAVDVLKMLPAVVWCQGILRGALPAWLLLLTLDRHSDVDVTIEVLLLGGILIWSVGVRAFRPFINEVILLERNPLVSRRRKSITVRRRSRQLHQPSASDLFARWMSAALIATLLTLSVYGTFLFVAGVFFNQWLPGPLMIAFGFPAAMWIVAGYLTVVRFLSYLDLRIRQEGWEVELRLRAEAARLAGQRG